MRCAPLCTTITQHGKWVSIERGASILEKKKEKKLALQVSWGASPSPASYLTNGFTKDPLHCLQRQIEKERWHVHMQLSPVYSGAQSEGVCLCARALVCSTLRISCSLMRFFFLHLCFSPDTHTHKQIAMGRVQKVFFPRSTVWH